LIVASALGVAGSAFGAATLLAPAACTTHQCDAQPFVEYKDDDPRHFVDSTTWQSSAIEDDWLYLGPQSSYSFHIPAFAGRHLVSTEAYVAVDPHPATQDTNWTNGAGNIVEFQGPAFQNCTDYVIVKNDTCGKYYVRVVIRVAPDDAGAECRPQPDAGADGAVDAGDAVDAAAD
jgi:hypothetical protein